jgi:DNA helicase II / ATP-dependent DNA helicase PcrA
MASFLSDLNESQREAAQILHGPLLILAGAGSGKTRTLTYRIAHMIAQGAASPDEILAVTFTNKAAAEMRKRVAGLVGKEHKVPTALSTFHSLGAKMLREQGKWHDRGVGFSIVNSGDSERLIKEAMGRLNVSRKELPISSVAKAISHAKNNRATPEMVSAQANLPRTRMIADVYRIYEQLLRRHMAFDFDDLLLRVVELLEREKSVRAAYQHRWRFLSVDEYQDTNLLQESLLQLLVGPEKNLCVVGDDYQAIYSWRGAKVDHILRFETSYPNCKTVYLTQNYRSTPQILQAANQVIAQNTVQKHKQLWTSEKAGEAVQVQNLPSERVEARFVREQIESHVRDGGHLKDCVVLYRTNAQSRIFEEEFLTHRLPYTIIGGFKFYDRREVKDALALLTLAVNPNSLLALTRVAQALMSGIGSKTLAKWAQGAEQAQQPVAVFAQQAAQRPVVQRMLTVITQTPASATHIMLQHLVVKTGYMKELRALPDGQEREENIMELLNVASTYEDPLRFLEDVALLSDIDTLQDQHDRITCMTLHAAKGLEYPLVFLVGCEEGLLPHGQAAFDQAQLEEERRLFYVGMTRAQKKLTLSFAAGRYIHGTFSAQAPSRFLEDLPTEVTWAEPEFSEPSDSLIAYDLPTFN